MSFKPGMFADKQLDVMLHYFQVLISAAWLKK